MTSSEISEELLPCPFCGSEPSVSTYETESLWSHNQVTYTKVECPECEIMFNSEPDYEVEAPEAWNRRAQPVQEMHELEGLPKDTITLVIAAREFWEANEDMSEESNALDKALEAFASRVPYANEPAALKGDQDGE